ncbi:MAG: helix-turn-helix domain-containing protein [Sphingobacterium sp.]|jgi:AraC-like DNA-binding protein|nr:helix-turn-helix domain-containing protein [Sphingobacterium sp.]
MIRGKDAVTVGESDLKENLSHPLPVSYTTLIICLEGNAVVSVNFKNYLLKANDILVLAEDSITIIQRLSNDFNSFYCLIDKAMASEVAYNLPNELFLFLHQTPLCRPLTEEAAFLHMWIEQIKYIKKIATVHQHLMLRNHLQNIFLRIAEVIPFTEIKTLRQFSHTEVLCWKFWDFVGKYSKEQRSVAFYANKLNITPYYLSQIIKDFLNDSPKDLIDRQVTLEIKALLRTTNLSIKEIAYRLHFEDSSYLGRYFKKQTGMTLTQYRK